ncbi:hypothetical protein ACFYVK_26375 [Streptomyces chartreusis]|uniref:hypothetical protein n=1 Tax=Streptomyces chartreusis TaxID=1969 RepID=UPI0036AB4DE6
MSAIDHILPNQKLGLLTEWSAEDAGESALASWGWSLSNDPEAGRHWRPRARGVSTDAERGFRFRGRAAALQVIVNWITKTHDERRVLVVTGSPGVGKSAVLGRIVTTADAGMADALPSDDGAVRAPVGSVACAVHARGKTASEVAREIAAAASAQLPERIDDLAPHLRVALAGRDPAIIFSIVIDALDEAVTPREARTIMRRVAWPLAETCADLGVRVVVGTRRNDDEGSLLSTLGSDAVVVDLDTNEYFSEGDLVAYALATLQLLGDERPDNPYEDTHAAASTAEQIAIMSQGNFLVAGLVARAHGMHDHQQIPLEELSFTPTVAAALETYLQQLPEVDGVSAKDVLTALAYAETPGLPVGLWRIVIAALSGRAPAEQQLRSFARSSAANFLLETSTTPSPTSVFRLFHQALNDALLAGGSRNIAEDEAVIAEALMRHGRSAGWHSAPPYLLRSLPQHASRGGVVNSLLIDPQYVLHADLRRLVRAASAAATEEGRTLVRLLRKTPRALDVTPSIRVALLSLTETFDALGATYRTCDVPSPYRAVWSALLPQQEETVLEGHTRPLTAVSTVRVGQRNLIATASEDHTVRIWDPETGEHLRTLISGAEPVSAMTALPIGGERDLLATAELGHDQKCWVVRVWEPESGALVRTIEEFTGQVSAIASVSNGDRTLLALVSDDHSVRIYDTESGTAVKAFNGHTDWVNAVASVIYGGRVFLATASDDGTVWVWDFESGDHLNTFSGHVGRVNAVTGVSSGDRMFLATAGDDETVRIWDLSTGANDYTLSGHTGPVNALVELSLGGRTFLATVSDDETVRIWDPVTWTLTAVLKGHAGWVNAISTVPAGDRTLIATGGADRTLHLWDPENRLHSQNEEGHIGAVHKVRAICTSSRTFIATASSDETVRLWDPETGQAVHVFDSVGHVRALSTVHTSHQTLLAITGGDSSTKLWDPETATQIFSLGSHVGAVNALAAVSLGGRTFLVTASSDNTVRIWDPETGDQVRSLEGHEAPVTALTTVSLGGRTFLVTASSDNTVRIWDPETGDQVRSLEGHEAPVTALTTVSLGGRTFLVTASSDNTVRIWDPETGDQVRTLHDRVSGVVDLATVQLGERTLLATACDDRTVRIWNCASGRFLLDIPVRHEPKAIDAIQGLLFVGTTGGIIALSLASEMAGFDQQP